MSYRERARGMLRRFRDDNLNYHTQNERLRQLPIRCADAERIFNMKIEPMHGMIIMPCEAFGRVFVLKIIDELLDEGGD